MAETPAPAYAPVPNDAENNFSSTAAGECGEATSGEAKAKLPKTPRGLKDETIFAAGDLVAGAGDSGAAASSRVVADNDQSTGRGSQSSGGTGTLRGLAVGSSQMGATVVSGKASAKPMASPRGTQEVDAIDVYASFSLPVAAVRRGSGGDGSPSPFAASHSGVAGRTYDKADGGDGVGGASSSRTVSNVTGKWRGEGCLSSLKARCSQKE